jgi:hypothetical protein
MTYFLRSILMEERLEWLTDGVSLLASLSLEDAYERNDICEGTEVTAEKQYFDGNIADVDKSSQSSTGISSEEMPDTDSSSGSRENQFDFVSKELQQLESSCGVEEQSDLVTEPLTQCDSPEGSDHCVLEDTSLDQSGLKNHEVDSAPDIQNDPDVKNCNGSSQGNVDDEQLDLFMNDTILPLMRSHLCEYCESSPRYVYAHQNGRLACC